MYSKRLIPITAVLALLVITAMVYHLKLGENATSVAGKPSKSAALGADTVVSQPPQTQAIQSVLAIPAPVEPRIEQAPIGVRLGSSQQSLDFIVALRDHQYLGLTKDEMEKLLTAYLEIGIERSIYEGSIATVKVINPTESLITIPAYPERGAEFQAELYRKFSQMLGADRGAEVQAALGSTLYARNFGFGETEQQIKVKLLDGEPITYSFVHSTGTLHVPYKGGYMTVKYGGLGSTHTLDDLNSYRGLIDLLPGGGS